MKVIGRIFAFVGVVILLSTLLTYVIAPEATWLLVGKIVFGVAAIGFYVVTNLTEMSDFIRSRSTGHLTVTIGIAVLVAGLLVLVNYLSVKNRTEFDLTSAGIHTLADQTLKVLETLDEEVTLTGYFLPDEPRGAAFKDLVGRYALHTDKLQWEVRNPDLFREEIERLSLKTDGPRVIVRGSGIEERVRDISEEGLTNGILRVSRGKVKKIYFLTGHGEPAITDKQSEGGMAQTADALTDEGFTVEELNLLSGEVAEVPTDAEALIIASAQTALLAPEIDAIGQYLGQGGHALVLLDPQVETGLAPLLAKWRIEVRDDLVIEMNPLQRVLGTGPDTPVVQDFGNHPITADFRLAVMFPTARSLAELSGEPELTLSTLARTGPRAWGETNFAMLQQSGEAEPNQVADEASGASADHMGPLALGIVASKPIADEQDPKRSDEARLTVFGDSDFAGNRFREMSGNANLLLNTVTWLVGEDELISIRPKKRKASRVFLTAEQSTFVTFFSIDILPSLLLAAGIAVWQLRRRT